MCSQATPEEINQFLRRAKHLIEKGRRQFSGERMKNLKTLADLEIRAKDIWNHIAMLTYRDYCSGPEPDREPDKYPDREWWVFGTDIYGPEGVPMLYVKLRIRNDNLLICLSFHEAERSLSFPYKHECQTQNQ